MITTLERKEQMVQAANAFLNPPDLHLGEVKPGSFGEWEKIGPKIAEEYLALSSGNRPLKKATIDRFVINMLAGNWRKNPQPIIFNDSGELDDGHHRLTAIVQSGTSQWFFVVRNSDKEAKLFMDSGVVRTDSDALIMNKYLDANANRVGILKRMTYGLVTNTPALPRNLVEENWKAWKDHTIFAESEMPRNYRQAGLLAAIAKARLDGIDDERLSRFKKPFIFDLDVLNEEDADLQPPTKLKQLIASKSIFPGNGGKGKEFYACCIAAIKCFLSKKPMKKKQFADNADFSEFV